MHVDQFIQSKHIWVNAASEGPLPCCAHRALEQAISWKSEPYLLHDKFVKVPIELKQALGRLMNVDASDVILGTSVSDGLCLLANNFPWERGDEVLLMENDFPSNILPWLTLEDQGVQAHQIKPQNEVLTPQEIEARISKNTKWMCLSHVHTFTGCELDIPAIAQIARKHQVHCVVNIAQSLGHLPVDVGHWDVDAVVGVGYKWLCGPYGTGFAWIHPNVQRRLKRNHPYWPLYLSEQELQETGPIHLKNLQSARVFDIFGTANFFNTIPLKAVIDFWLDTGIDQVQKYIDQLTAQFIAGLDRTFFTLISPEESHLIVISLKNQTQNKPLFQKLLDHNIHPAYWKHNLRFSFHTYNTAEHADHVLQILHESALSV